MNLSKTLGETELIATTKAVVELGELAMAFGRVDRTCVVHPNGMPESDTDHTVMLAWVAPALAEMINLRAGFERYPVGKVTQFAVVHDAVEVYAGDTPTHKITAEGLAAKELNEAQAANKLYNQFVKRLPWFARMVRSYEAQVDPVARFVRSVDKIMPKIVHVLNASTDLVRAGLSYDDFVALYTRQRQQIEDWCPEPLLLQLYDELCGEVGRQYQDAANKHFVVTNMAIRTVERWGVLLEHPVYCAERATTCDVGMAFNAWTEKVDVYALADGRYEVRAAADGMLEFCGKRED